MRTSKFNNNKISKIKTPFSLLLQQIPISSNRNKSYFNKTPKLESKKKKSMTKLAIINNLKDFIWTKITIRISLHNNLNKSNNNNNNLNNKYNSKIICYLSNNNNNNNNNNK